MAGFELAIDDESQSFDTPELRATVKRHADKGRLVVKIDGQPTAVLHRDPVNGYWAWKEHLALWMAQNTVAIGATDIREHAG